MMTEKEIKEYAVKGLNSEISRLNDSVYKGQTILRNRSQGDMRDKSPLSDLEIRKVIATNQAIIKDLISKRDDLEWEINTEI